MTEEIDFFEQDKPVDQITMKELDELGERIFKQRKVCDNLTMSLSCENIALDQLQQRMIALLEKLGRSNYTVPGMGMLMARETMTVTIPKDPTQKDEFYQYLKDKGVFEALVTVNYQTLNAFYNEEFKRAAEEGRSMEFKIPGLDEPKTRTTLAMKKGK